MTYLITKSRQISDRKNNSSKVVVKYFSTVGLWTDNRSNAAEFISATDVQRILRDIGGHKSKSIDVVEA